MPATALQSALGNLSTTGLKAEFASILQPAWARAARPSWPLLAGVVLAVVSGCVAGPWEYGTWSQIIGPAVCVAAFIGGSVVYATYDRPRAALVLEAFAQTIAVGLTVPGVTCMLASLKVPYRDAQLLAADRALGFDWQAIVLWFGAHPQLSEFVAHCYSSILWQPVVLLPLLAFADPEKLRRILAASAWALLFTIAVFALVPAKTGYVYLGYEPGDFPHLLTNTSWGVYEVLEAIRGGDRKMILEGLVTFPSYHAVAAVLFAYGWMSIPVLRWPFAVLNAIMLIACVPSGSHYVVDVIAGVVIACVTVRAADRYYVATDRLPPLARWDDTPEGARLQAVLNRFGRFEGRACSRGAA